MVAAVVQKAVGSATAAFGSIASGIAAGRTAEFNARIAEDEGSAALASARLAVEKTQREGKRVRSRQRGIFARAGVDPSRGSALAVLAEAAEDEEFEVLLHRHAGQVGLVQAQNKAKAKRFEGSVARRMAFINATSSILGGTPAARKMLSVDPDKIGGGARQGTGNIGRAKRHRLSVGN